MKILSTFRFLGIIALAISISVGCAWMEGTNTTTARAVKQTPTSAIAAAKTAIAKAKSVKWIWRDTEKILKSAEAAAKKGQGSKAIKLANKARDQAVLAVKQYHYEKRMNRGIKPISGMLGTYTAG